MAAWRYEISLLVLKIFNSSLRLLVKYYSISARPCNILYIFIKEEWNNFFIIPVQMVPFPL